MQTLSQEQAERDASYLDLPCCEPRNADIALVFGNRLQLLYIAVDMLKRSVVRYIGVTSPRNKEGISGSQALLDLFARLGVPAECVIVLDHPVGEVLESVVFALPRIAARIPLARLQNVVVVCEWYAARHVLMILKRVFPRAVRYYLRSCEPEDLTRPRWYLCAEGAERIIAERQRIAHDVKRGYALELEQEEDNSFT